LRGDLRADFSECAWPSFFLLLLLLLLQSVRIVNYLMLSLSMLYKIEWLLIWTRDIAVSGSVAAASLERRSSRPVTLGTDLFDFFALIFDSRRRSHSSSLSLFTLLALSDSLPFSSGTVSSPRPDPLEHRVCLQKTGV
jgi:hypothetical protein